MTMDKTEGAAAMEVERFSKLGTLKLQQGHPQKALEAYRNAYQSAQSLGHHGYMQRACAFNLGAMLISMGSYNDGLMYLNQAVPPDGQRDGRSNGDLFFNYGLAYEGLKNMLESKRYFIKALKEYEYEHKNVKMEADTIHRLGKICLTNGQLSEAESWMRQLIQAYSTLGDEEKKLKAQAERANLLLKLERLEEAEEVADICLEAAKNISETKNVLNVLNELGLVYSQMSKYDKALECTEGALPLARSSSADPTLVTVLYQNLGALYNCMGKYEEAIKYHQAAANKHAEMKNRRSQGHCFVNMGYAYSQLKNMDKAGECFLHAQQAAKDCGDRKSEWQSFEALGSVAYNQGSLKRSQDYYKQALAVLGKSPEPVDSEVQDRIMAKLTYLIQKQLVKPAANPAVSSNINRQKVQKGEVVASPGRDGQQVEKTVKHTLKETTKSLQGKGVKEGVVVITKGGKTKYLKVRRSGSLRRFKKVALGLETYRPTSVASVPARGNAPSESESEEELLSARSISPVQEEESDLTDSQDNRRPVRPPDSFIPQYHTSQRVRQSSEQVEEWETMEVLEDPNEDEGEVEEVDVNSDEEEDDEEVEKRKVREAMQQLASPDNKYMMLETQPNTSQVVADVHSEAQPKQQRQSDESGSESGSDSDTNTYSSTEDEDEQHKQQSRRPPPIPTRSAPSTAQRPVRTYELPVGKELHYETIDHKPPPAGHSLQSRSKATNEGERKPPPRSMNSHPNFFQDDVDGQRSGKISGSKSERVKKPPEGDTQEGTIYESVRPQSRIGRNTPGAEDGSDDGEIEEAVDDDLSKMSRAEREVFLHNQFQAGRGGSRNTKGEQKPDQENSKHCIVM